MTLCPTRSWPLWIKHSLLVIWCSAPTALTQSTSNFDIAILTIKLSKGWVFAEVDVTRLYGINSTPFLAHLQSPSLNTFKCQNYNNPLLATGSIFLRGGVLLLTESQTCLKHVEEMLSIVNILRCRWRGWPWQHGAVEWASIKEETAITPLYKVTSASWLIRVPAWRHWPCHQSGNNVESWYFSLGTGA